jgi:hypothetical protein
MYVVTIRALPKGEGCDGVGVDEPNAAENSWSVKYYRLFNGSDNCNDTPPTIITWFFCIITCNKKEKQTVKGVKDRGIIITWSSQVFKFNYYYLLY